MTEKNGQGKSDLVQVTVGFELTEFKLVGFHCICYLFYNLLLSPQFFGTQALLSLMNLQEQLH